MAVLELVLTLGVGGVECVRVPGWTVLGVAALLTAPRLVSQWLEDRSEG